MARYKVINSFEMNGVAQEVGTVLELSVEQVDNFGIANLEEVKDEVAEDTKESDVEVEKGADEEVKTDSGAEEGSAGSSDEEAKDGAKEE